MKYTVKTTTAIFVLTLSLALLGCSDDTNPVGADGGAGDIGATLDRTVRPDAATTTILTSDQLINACIRFSACRIKAYASMSSCVEAYYNLYRPQGRAPIYDKIFSCVNAAKGDCKAMAACFGQKGECDNTYKASCSGDVAMSCDLLDKKVYATNCGHAKMKCAVPAGQATLANCTPGSCTSSFKPRCVGDVLHSCTGGLIEAQDCLAQGSFCVETEKSGSYCRGNRRAVCSSKTFKKYCLKDVAVTCHQGREHWQDCGTFGAARSRCVSGACVAAAKECSQALNRCAGDKLEICLDGKWRSVDCTKLGLAKCKLRGLYGNCTDPNAKPGS